MSEEDLREIQIGDKECRVDEEDADTLHCLNPETGEEQEMDINDIDPEELG